MERRLARVLLSYEAVLDMIRNSREAEYDPFKRRIRHRIEPELPEDSEIVSVKDDWCMMCFDIVVRSQSFEEVEMGQELPVYGTWMTKAVPGKPLEEPEDEDIP